MNKKKPIISVVVLHGWGLSKNIYKQLCQKLRNYGYKVYSLDLPGFGSLISTANPLTLKDYVEYVHNFLIKNEIYVPIIIGHSFGGRVGIKYCEKYQNNVKALILTGTPGIRSVNSIKYIILKLVSKTGNILLSSTYFGSIKNLLREKFYRFIGVPDYTKANPIMKETFKNVVAEELITAMKSIDIPTFLIWGEKDEMVPLKVMYGMQNYIKHNRTLIIPDTNHGLPYKHPDIFSRHIHLFIKSL